MSLVPRTFAATHHVTGAEFTFERTLPVAAQPVLDAWTTPERLARWHGPAGTTRGHVLEETPPHRVVMTVNGVHVTVLLEPVDGGTRMRVVHRFNTPGDARAFEAAGAGAALALAADRLELILLMEHPPATMLTLSRDLAAPRDRVFAALTQPAALDTWWGPDGFVTTTQSMELREGGDWRFTMAHPVYGTFPNRARWTLIQPPERLDFLHDDGAGQDGHRAVLWLEAITADTTRIHLCQFHPSVERRAEVEGFGAVELGGQTLRKLAEWVAAHA